MRTLFGHQSVGANLIDGLRTLAPRALPALRIVESRTAPDDSPSLLCHFRVGRNHDPHGKIADFAAALAAGGDAFDLALFKFCYVDLEDAAAADALFAHYSRTLSGLQEKHPRLRFGHVTVPLRAAPSPMQRFVHGTLLRRSHPEHARNAARERFNQRLRAEFDGEVFDLAALESHGTDGVPRLWRQRGVSVPVLARELSDDGGHLNERGRQAVARAFVDFLTRA
jgi:hypothetical protein